MLNLKKSEEIEYESLRKLLKLMGDNEIQKYRNEGKQKAESSVVNKMLSNGYSPSEIEKSQA